MGCCISKCRPDKHSLQEHHNNNVNMEDKLVISQAPPIPLSNKISPSPPSPTSSTSSISSFTCTATSSNTISSTSSLSNTSSAFSFTSKDRSFSNEFLWSCYKDNPHITRINSLRDASFSLKPIKAQCRKIGPSPVKPNSGPIKHSPQQKRVRSNSPTNLTRQKSFRRELPERGRSTIGSPSPSPSRRFNGDKSGISILDNNKRVINNSPKVSVAHCYSVSSSMRNEGFKASSPNNSSRRIHNYSGLRRRESCALRIGSKIDETVVNDVMMSEHDMDSMMEDIDNPLISLDCFIFL